MALPNILRRLFKNNGYGPELKPEILPDIIATGATSPRYLGDRFADIVNLRDFGATGDGETDDSTAWAAWRTALQNGGMPFIPKGDYLLGEEIVHAPKGHFGCNTTSFSYEDDGPMLGEFDAEVYVDASVSTSGDGLTPSTAVKTITDGIGLLNKQPSLSGHKTRLHIKAGTYTEDVLIENLSGFISLNGNVVINGSLQVSKRSCILITQESTGSLSITATDDSAVKVFDASCLFVGCDVDVSSSNSDSCIRVVELSFFYVEQNVSVVGNTIGTAIYCTAVSTVAIGGNISISGSSIDYGFGVSDASLLKVFGNVTTTSALSIAVYATDMSHAYFTGSTHNFYGSGNVIFARYFSKINITGFTSCTINRTGSGSCIEATRKGVIEINASNIADSTLSLNFGDNTNGTCINAWDYGQIILTPQKVVCSGKCAKTVGAATGGYVLTYSNVAFSGSVTGKRYEAASHGIIYTGGSGANKFPGTTAGTVNSTTFGLYI